MPKEISAKSVLNKTKKRDHLFLDDYTLNLYSSCSFNCLYCYIRGSKYGYNLASSLSVKINAIDLLERQLALRARKKQHGFIVLSSATDPYLKADREYQLTRKALEVIAEYRFPVHILTKSSEILRDIDLIKKIQNNAILPKDLEDKVPGGALISFSFSTLDDKVGRIFEPGAPPPSKRLETLAQVLQLDLPAGVSLMPLLPWISDTTDCLEEFFSTFSTMKAYYVLPSTITLFGSEKTDSKTLILGALQKHYPHLLPKYKKYFTNGSQMPTYYQKAFSKKMTELSHTHNIPLSIATEKYSS